MSRNYFTLVKWKMWPTVFKHSDNNKSSLQQYKLQSGGCFDIIQHILNDLSLNPEDISLILIMIILIIFHNNFYTSLKNCGLLSSLIFKDLQLKSSLPFECFQWCKVADSFARFNPWMLHFVPQETSGPDR